MQIPTFLKLKNKLREGVFYKPAFFYLIVDLLLLILNFYLVFRFFPFTTHYPLEKYFTPSLICLGLWFVLSYFLKRYKPLKIQQLNQITLGLVYVSLACFILLFLTIHFYFKSYSGFVLLTTMAGAFNLNYTFISLYFASRFAVDYDAINTRPNKDRINATVKPSVQLDDESYNQLISTIKLHTSEKVLAFLKHNIDLSNSNTLVYLNTDVSNLLMKPNYIYSSIIQLERLNNMRNINYKLSVINEKLPDNGIFVCCFESKSTRKKRIISRIPKGLNYVAYTFYFLFKRVMPKIFITRRLYYFIMGERNRIFSKAEVLGRLYCLGFKVVQEKKIGQLTYVISERAKEPEMVYKRNYGTLIRLQRYGKHRKAIEVYKIRTMHPYSEYLQSYVYEHHKLNKEGKFRKDMRVTTIGRIMRKYWIDELPMIINLIKGEMKLVGVRPLSLHYFNLYNKDLQEKRIKYKPGLLPPFYADMPQTLAEIQASEMNYLIACETKGVFKTDVRYLIAILKNILIKKARSS